MKSLMTLTILFSFFLSTSAVAYDSFEGIWQISRDGKLGRDVYAVFEKKNDLYYVYWYSVPGGSNKAELGMTYVLKNEGNDFIDDRGRILFSFIECSYSLRINDMGSMNGNQFQKTGKPKDFTVLSLKELIPIE